MLIYYSAIQAMAIASVEGHPASCSAAFASRIFGQNCSSEAQSAAAADSDCDYDYYF